MLANVIRIFWTVESEYRAARAAGDANTARQCIEELESMAMYDEVAAPVRRRALQTIREAAAEERAPHVARRAAVEALAALEGLAPVL